MTSLHQENIRNLEEIQNIISSCYNRANLSFEEEYLCFNLKKMPIEAENQVDVIINQTNMFAFINDLDKSDQLDPLINTFHNQFTSQYFQH